VVREVLRVKDGMICGDSVVDAWVREKEGVYYAAYGPREEYFYIYSKEYWEHGLTFLASKGGEWVKQAHTCKYMLHLLEVAKLQDSVGKEVTSSRRYRDADVVRAG